MADEHNFCISIVQLLHVRPGERLSPQGWVSGLVAAAGLRARLSSTLLLLAEIVQRAAWTVRSPPGRAPNVSHRDPLRSLTYCGAVRASRSGRAWITQLPGPPTVVARVPARRPQLHCPPDGPREELPRLVPVRDRPAPPLMHPPPAQGPGLTTSEISSLRPTPGPRSLTADPGLLRSPDL